MTLRRPDGKWTLKLDGTAYDAKPFDVTLVGNDGGVLPLSAWIPGFALGERPVLGRPWVCLSGTRAFYLYEGHHTKRWDAVRFRYRARQPARSSAGEGGDVSRSGDLHRLRLPAVVLEQAREWFEDRGTCGCEGTAMIARGGDGVRLVVPDRRATRSTLGVSVEVTRRGQLQLATALGPDDLYVARIHSHPGEAFHSPADDANPGAAAGLGAETSGETLDEAGRTRRRRCPPVPLRLHCPALTHEARCAAAAAVAPLLTDMPQEPHHDNGRDGATA